MSICQVSQNNAFSRYACINYHYTYPLTPLPHDRRHHRPFLHITHLSTKMLIGVLDDVSWEGEEDLEEGGRVVLRSYHVIWEVGDKFFEWRSPLIYMGGTFQSIYLCVLDLLLLFNLTVLSNKYPLSFHWCSDIDPIWVVRFQSAAFLLSITVCNTYHSHLLNSISAALTSCMGIIVLCWTVS